MLLQVFLLLATLLLLAALHHDVGAQFLAVAYFTLAHDVKVFWS
jgi:hypothetical protein